MEEPSRIVPSVRDRKPGEALTVIPAPSVLPWDQVPREPHLLDYLIILRKHQWLILTFLLTVVTVVTIASFKMKPVYEAAARVEVDKEAQAMQPFPGLKWLRRIRRHGSLHRNTNQDPAERDSGSDDYQIIRPRSLSRIWRHSQLPSPGSTPAPTPSRPAILGAFLGRLAVKRVPNSRLIEVISKRKILSLPPRSSMPTCRIM